MRKSTCGMSHWSNDCHCSDILTSSAIRADCSAILTSSASRTAAASCSRWRALASSSCLLAAKATVEFQIAVSLIQMRRSSSRLCSSPSARICISRSRSQKAVLVTTTVLFGDVAEGGAGDLAEGGAGDDGGVESKFQASSRSHDKSSCSPDRSQKHLENNSSTIKIISEHVSNNYKHFKQFQTISIFQNISKHFLKPLKQFEKSNLSPESRT